MQNPISLRGFNEYDLDFLKIISSQVDILSLDVLDSTLPLLKIFVSNIKLTLTNYEN